MNSSVKLIVLFTCCLLLATFVLSASLCVADDHKGGRKHFEKHDVKGSERNFRRIRYHGHDEGNETTGQIAAWSLAVANLPVVLSMLIKAIRRFAPLEEESRNSLLKFNSFQKRHLMVLHYILNPLILAVAILHWTLSRCQATALPEWGLLTMAAVVGLGITLKFRLCPKSFLRNVYSIHTKPWVLLFFVSMLLIGHFSMD